MGAGVKASRKNRKGFGVLQKASGFVKLGGKGAGQ